MEYRDEFNTFDELYKLLWGSALDVMDDIRDRGFANMFIEELESYFYGEEPPTLTELNDFIRFESDTIYEGLGLMSTSVLDDYDEIKALYRNLKDYKETYYSRDDLRDIFTGMSWEEIHDIVDDFTDTYDDTADYLWLDDNEKVLHIDLEFADLFY